MSNEGNFPKGDSTKSEREIEVEGSYEKFNTHGRLGVTAKDHYNIGSSAPIKLKDNPDKTSADLMSDDQLLEYLGSVESRIQEDLAEMKQRMTGKALFEPIDVWTESNLRSDLSELKLTINHLRSLGRLPKKYETYQPLEFPTGSDRHSLQNFLENH